MSGADVLWDETGISPITPDWSREMPRAFWDP
jgi:hypothetical protein